MENSKFSISVVGNKTGTQWVGEFTVKPMLSHRDEIRRDRIRRELIGPEFGNPTDHVWNLAVTFSELTVRVVAAPPFWTSNGDGMDLMDTNVVTEVYKKTMEIEASAAAKIKADAEAATAALRKEG